MIQITITACERSEHTEREPKGRIRRTALPKAGHNLLLLAPDIQEQILFLPLTTEGSDHVTERGIQPIIAELSFANQRHVWDGVRQGLGA